MVTNKIPESMIDMIRTKSVAIAACAFTVSEQEKLYINFTEPVSTQTYTFLVARPRELSRALLFMSPFNKEVVINRTPRFCGCLGLFGFRRGCAFQFRLL